MTPITKPENPENQFEPHQSSLKHEPIRCPHCGEPLPAEPEVMAPDERIHDPSRPDVRYTADAERVEIYGGDSGFSEADPFAIHADQVTSTGDVAHWMAQIGAKSWVREEEFLQDLGEALCLALSVPAPASTSESR